MSENMCSSGGGMEEKERRASEPRLSLAQKMEVLRLHDSKEYSYRKIAASFDVQLKSIQNIVRNRVSIEEKARSATQEELLAIPPLSPYEAMETRLRAWIETQDPMPSGPAMCEKANALLVEMAEPGSQPATVKIKWVDRFKERHKLSKKRQAPPAGCSSTTGGDKRHRSLAEPAPTQALNDALAAHQPGKEFSQDGGQVIAACTTDKPFDRPLNDHYLLPSADGMAPADGSLTTNDATRLVVTNAATAGKHLPLVLSVVLGAKDTEPPAMVSAVNASYDARDGVYVLGAGTAGGEGLAGREGITLYGCLVSKADLLDSALAARAFIRLRARELCQWFGLGEELAASLEQPWPRIIVDIAPHCVSHSGASCGAAIFLSLLQLRLGVALHPGVAVTGIVCLRGRVAHVANLLEKTRVALHYGANKVILPGPMTPELEAGLTEAEKEKVVFVKNVPELLAAACPGFKGGRARDMLQAICTSRPDAYVCRSVSLQVMVQDEKPEIQHITPEACAYPSQTDAGMLTWLGQANCTIKALKATEMAIAFLQHHAVHIQTEVFKGRPPTICPHSYKDTHGRPFEVVFYQQQKIDAASQALPMLVMLLHVFWSQPSLQQGQDDMQAFRVELASVLGDFDFDTATLLPLSSIPDPAAYIQQARDGFLDLLLLPTANAQQVVASSVVLPEGMRVVGCDTVWDVLRHVFDTDRVPAYYRPPPPLSN